MNIDKLNKELDRLNEEVANLEDWIDMLRDYLEPSFPHGLVLPPHPPRLTIFDLNDLHRAREWLRGLYGSWNDTFTQVFPSGEEIIAVWTDDRRDMRIWLCSHADTFPPELLSNGCQIVKKAINTYDIICGIDEGS